MSENKDKNFENKIKLQSANQQLKANQQQLKATEQQLKAANQQLRSSEQQLKAANQQLKANEQELLRSRQLYKTIFEGSINGLAVYEVIDKGADFIIKEFNSAAEEIENISRKDIIGKSIFEVFPGIKEFGLWDVFKRVHKTGKSEHCPVSIYKDKRITGWRDNYVFKLESGEIVASYKDVTKRKQAEYALQVSEEKLRAFYDNAPLPCQSLDKDGCYIDVNHCWLKTLGYERQEVIGKHYTDFLHPDWKPNFEKNFSEFKQRGYIHDAQLKMKHKDGYYLYVSFEGRIGYWPDGSFRQTYCVFQDITERKWAEESLKFQAMLLDQIQDHIIATDLQGNITYINSAVVKRMGLPREYFIGHKVDVLGENPQLGATQKEVLEKTLSDGQWHGEIVNRTADGEEFILDCKTYSVYDSNGRRKGLSSLSRDITQLKQNEKQMIEYQHQLRGLVAELAIAEERERKRIASELHDNICQNIVFLKMKVDSAISKGLTEKNDSVLSETSKDIADILNDLQYVTNDLGSNLLYGLGLKSALKEWISKEIVNKHKIPVNFTSDEDYHNLDDDMKNFLFRTIKELLINVVKHAKASSITVSLKRNEKVITVSVIDDGIGLKGSKGKVAGNHKNGGYGLFRAKEKLHYLGGSITFIRENEPGTRVEITVPINRQ